jgi:FixJ family two-component response regulator
LLESVVSVKLEPHILRAFEMSNIAQGCVVYIVDDDDLVRKGLERLMRAGGFRPKCYESPERFLQEVGPGGPACILLDITMPRMSGLQVQAELKARGIVIPVIAVSARDDDDTRRRARELDAWCFLRKPVDDQALLDAITWVTGPNGPLEGPVHVT